MQQPYSEKEVLADALTAEKTATDHYNTFANECVHENVRNAILDCLDKGCSHYSDDCRYGTCFQRRCYRGIKSRYECTCQ